MKGAFRKVMTQISLESTMNFLEKVFQEIQKSNQYTSQQFAYLYKTCYFLVLQKHGERLYKMFKNVVTYHLQQNIREDVLRANNNNFLLTLNVAWTCHRKAMKTISGVLMYLDRVYVQQNDLENTFKLGLRLFREEIISHERIESRLSLTLLGMVIDERKGYAIDYFSIRNAIQMLMALGSYEDDFEYHFLNQSNSYFSEESSILLSENNSNEYIKRVEAIFMVAERSKFYLKESTKQRLDEIIKEEFVKKHLKKIAEMESSELNYTTVDFMLENSKIDDLELMFSFFSNSTDGVETFSDCVSQCFNVQGSIGVSRPSS